VAARQSLFFSGEGGLLAGWNPAAGTATVVTYPAPSGDSGGAIYKGLAIACRGHRELSLRHGLP